MFGSSLPSVAKHFNIGESISQITSSVYFLGFATGILLFGRASDIFGRRPIILLGLSIYIISSIISIFAINIEMLIILRFCQAIGASVGSVIGQAMARDSYEGKELSYIYATIAIGIALIPSICSAIGGYIIEYSNWQGILVFQVTFISILLIVYFNLLPETNPYIGISSNNKYFTIFKVVIRDKKLLLYSFVIGAFNGMLFGFFIEAPFIFINKIGLSPSFYGKLAFLLSSCQIFGSWLNRYLMRLHIDNKKIMIAGFSLSLIGCSMLVISSCLFSITINKYLLIVMIFFPMMLHMIGHTLLIPMTLRYVLEDYSKVTGSAGSICGTLYYIVVAVIIFIISKLHSENLIKFSLLLLSLSILCSVSFYLVQSRYNKVNTMFS